jgi:hypothetical protein
MPMVTTCLRAYMPTRLQTYDASRSARCNPNPNPNPKYNHDPSTQTIVKVCNRNLVCYISVFQVSINYLVNFAFTFKFVLYYIYEKLVDKK